MKLNAEQKALLDYASDADDAWRQAKLHAAKRAKEMIEREIASYAAARDKAVYDAIEAGVPRRQVGQLGLKTTSPNTVADAYNRVAAQTQLAEVPMAVMHKPKYSWSQVHTHPVSERQFAFLYIDGDDHETVVEDAWMNGPGYLYIKPADKWVAFPHNPPRDAAQWALENVPS